MKFTINGETQPCIDSLSVIERKAESVGGRRFYYALLEIRSGAEVNYAIAVGEGGTVEVRVIEKGIDAEKIFCLIKDGGITLCTLNDVIDDLTYILMNNEKKYNIL